MGNEDLGNHYYSIGDLNNAVKAYSRMRDYCTTPAHIASTSFRMIQVAVEQGNWLAVQSQVHKIRNLQMKTDDAARNQPKTQVAMGLYQMCTGEYREAAASFLATDPSLTDTYNEVLSPNDVAIYGGLCALASMDRHELQTKVLENASFRNFLELEPHIRRAISFFCSSKYAQCLDILEAYRADYLLDIYLQAHVPNIYRRIRTKSIVQYFAPFSRVTLDAMAKTFGTTATPHQVESASQSNGSTMQAQSIEDELISLIGKGILNAKIDLEARVLVAKESNVRADVHAEAQDMVKAYIREVHMRLLRMNAINAGLEIKAPQKSGKQHMTMDPMDLYQNHQQDQHQMSRDDMTYGLGGEQGRGFRGGGPNTFTGKGRML
jgi:COP9 signalosome complex subunit 1